MRTKQQIENLRKVFFHFIGMYAIVASDDMINALADRLQDQIDSHYVTTWSTKVRLMEHGEIPWEQIDPEPAQPICSLLTIKRLCCDLLIKYPRIVAIEITDVKHKETKVCLDRGS